MIVTIISAFIALLLGLGLGYLIRQLLAKSRKNSAEAKAEQILHDTETKQKEILIAAKDKSFEINEAAKKEEQVRRQQLISIEDRLSKREETLDQRFLSLDQKQKQLFNESQKIKYIRREVEGVKTQQLATLEKVANLSQERAKEVLLEMVEKGMQDKIVERIKRMNEVIKEKSDREAQKIISLAIQRYSQSQASETTATTVSLPSDDMKGRIIGREGRNIKKIEELTGIEIVVDDTPGAIVISGFSPIRRHVAKRTLEKLIVDGRIHPARIEETVTEVKQEIAKEIREAGEQAVYDLGVADLDPKIVQLLGRLKFRTSYGQNVLNHSIEVANLSAIMAEELGANVAVAKKAGLLHDIGKAVDHEIEGTHVEIGRNILKKFGISEDIIHAVECHHEDVAPRTVEAMIVDAADAISGSRVGARKDSYENYIKRLEELEGLALSFPGVEKSYAIQAGREVRVFVIPESIDDIAAAKLSEDIASKIEKELKYPGEIKVNVIRETRAIAYAR